MTYPEFSVVMAVYKKDSAENLKQAIVSLLAQSVLPSEIIIVVDGWICNDVAELLKQYSLKHEIRILQNDANEGLAYSLNRGIANARYDLIARMDADDICLPLRFETQLRYMINNSLDCVGGQVLEFGKDLDDILNVRQVPLYHEQIVKQMKWKSAFNHPTVIFKKAAFLLIQGYSTLIFPEDLDFFARLKLSGVKFGNVAETVLYFRVGTGYNEMLKRRWGLKYAQKELKLYINYYRIGFYSVLDLLLAIMLKVPLRILPFVIFKRIYSITRK